MTALSGMDDGDEASGIDYGSIPVSDFDNAEAADAAAELLPCCASRRWVSEIVTGRPYHSLSGLAARSDAVLATLGWPDVVQALEPAGAGSTAAVVDADSGNGARLLEARRRYERKFGYRFVICGVGLSPDQVLAALVERLDHNPFVERSVAAGELTRIVRQRLATAFH